MLTLTILPNRFTIHRLAVGTPLPPEIWGSAFYAITQTADELSVVAEESIPFISSEQSQLDWLAFKVMGPLDFSLTGILARLSHVLAEANISIFAISTFDTDYILVKAEHEAAATAALRQANYIVL